jgi:hypothetical protein
MISYSQIRETIVTELKFLAFRPVRPNLREFGGYYLGLGLITAWLAGVGRYWDNPRAELWQYLGLGSVAYIFVLAFILWVLIKPLKPENWSYRSVLTFVGMTSPPALFYAIPVERYFSLSTAQTMNVWFLLIVASWRVILLVLYLKRSAKLSAGAIIIAALLPLTIIVSILTALNLEHVVFRIMAGLMEDERSANDAAYTVLWLITTLSVMASPLLVISYLVMIYQKWRGSASSENT